MKPEQLEDLLRYRADAKTFVAAIEAHLRSVGHLAIAQEGNE